jgi:glucose-1-phosphate thymidylyltransferase
MKALILAGGYATRLYPITKFIPKPLLLINGKPMIEFIVDKLMQIDNLDEIIIVTNAKFYNHFRLWQERITNANIYGIRITVINDLTTADGTKRGAIGDMQYVVDQCKVDDDLIIVGGDNLFEFAMPDLISYFNERKKNIVVLHDIHDKEAVKRFSIVELNHENKLINFEEKPKDPRTTLIAICCYILKKETVPRIKEYLEKGNNPDTPGYLIEWLYENDEVYGYVFSESWYDIGNIEQFEEANLKYANL